MSFFPDRPFNDLQYLPPRAELETKTILRQAVRANKVLAELKGYSQLLPNNLIITNSLLLQEAKDSSEIENIVTTHDELYKALTVQSEQNNPNVKEVLNYRAALHTGFRDLKKNGYLTTNSIVEIQRILMQNEAGIRKLPGTKLADYATGETLYTPPDNEQTIRNLLKNLEEYINEENSLLDPLIKLAVLHYQFESIHPFYDGNGRTGRILNVLYLVLTGLLDEPSLYLSRYIIAHKAEYYRLLRQVTQENIWEPWILYILKAVEETAFFTLELSKKIRAAMDDASATIQAQLPKMYAKPLVEMLFANVYIKISHLVDNKISSRNTAARYLKSLENIGILRSEKVWRETVYVNTALYNLLADHHTH